MKRTVTVLQDDIDNGTQTNSSDCAIARAANRELADLLAEGEHFGVAGAALYRFRPPGSHCRPDWPDRPDRPLAFLTAEAHRFYRQFDSGVPVEPFKFEVELEDPE